MKIRELKIVNFRGFQELIIKFPEDTNVIVFIGVNGAGKSAVLDAIGILLGILFNKVRAKIPKVLNRDDIKLNTEKYLLEIAFFHSTVYSMSLNEPLPLEEKLTGSYEVFIDQIRKSSNYPLFIYHPINRIFNEENSNFDSRNKPDLFSPQCYAYEKAFSDYSTSPCNIFDIFIRWFRQQEDLENQNKIAEQDFNIRSELLEAIRIAISKFLNKFQSAQFSNLRIERKQNIDNRFIPDQEFNISELCIDKDGQRFKFSQLSSGEQMVLFLVADIARRLAIANPILPNKLEGEGVILIDEIDLHLHPQWQRRILPALTSTFPNLQFIVTTHSPQVLSHLSRNSVILLEDHKISEKEIYTEGRDSNSILQDAFHVPIYEKKYEQELRDIYYLIDDHKIDEAQSKLNRLIEKRGDGDREVMRMQSYIDMADL